MSDTVTSFLLIGNRPAPDELLGLPGVYVGLPRLPTACVIPGISGFPYLPCAGPAGVVPGISGFPRLPWAGPADVVPGGCDLCGGGCGRGTNYRFERSNIQ